MSDYVRLGKYEIDDVLKHVSLNPEDKPKNVRFNGHRIFMGSKRYQNFKAHGNICVECGLVGTHFYLERHKNQMSGNYHFNMYGLNSDGEEVMLTKDHIVPKAKGGLDEIINFQVMCSPCNSKKGDKWLSQEQLIHQARINTLLPLLEDTRTMYGNLMRQHKALLESCPHDIVPGPNLIAKCSVCRQDNFGRFCKDSPTKVCEYDEETGPVWPEMEDYAECKHCGMPRVRKD